MNDIRITPEELVSWADGEITGARALFIKASVETDASLQAQLAAHQALKDRLGQHFAPIAEQPVPDRLVNMLSQKEAEVVDFATEKTQRGKKRRLPRWSWVAGPALAASLAVAVFLPRGGSDLPGEGYAGTQLASALETQLLVQQDAAADTRILLSFQNNSGEFCRAYTSKDADGIACHDNNGWRIETLGDGSTASGTEFRQAGTSEIMAETQEMAAGGALDAAEEEAARKSGWIRDQ